MTYRLAQLTVARLARLVWRLRVTGAERMPAGAVIVVANHESMLDPFFLAAAFRRPLRFVTKGELFVGPLGWLLERLGGIRIVRGRGDLAALAQAEQALRAGHAVMLFPQGTTIPHGERPWLRGAARLARATGAPILPIAIVDSEKALRPVRVKVGFPSVRVLVGEPIAVERAPSTIAEAKALTARARDAVDALRAPSPPPAHVRG